MTDYPQFQTANGEPDRCYRQYHGAALVALVFRAADWWLKHRDTTTTVRPYHPIQLGGCAMIRRNVETTRTARVCQVASLLAVLSMVLGVLAHDLMRTPGTTTAQRESERLVVAP